MAISRGSHTHTLVTCTCVFMLIFCFVESVAGSCMSYGHSCWGAHGKRSGVRSENGLRVGSTRISTNDAGDLHNFAPSTREQWLLSRLIGKRPLISMSNRHRVRWNDVPKSGLLSRQWNNEEVTTSVMNDDTLGARSNNDDGAGERRINEIEETMRDVGDDPTENTEFLFVPRNEYRVENDPQTLSLLEILGKSGGKFK